MYFSGHGQTVKSGTGGDVGFLIPEDASVDMDDLQNPGPYASTCLLMRDVWDELSLSPARHTLVIADACFGGLLTSRGLNSEVIASQLSRPARMAFTAGGKDETSSERPDLGHGLFTYVLLQELKARAIVGTPFLISDLYNSVNNSVEGMSHGNQNPQLKSDETEGQLVFAPVVSAGLPFTAAEARDLLYHSQFDKAFSMFQELSDKGDPDGIAGLASVYLSGQGTTRDYPKALALAKESADKGSPWGMSIYGWALTLSDHPDYSEALTWYKKSADLGDPAGMDNLGWCYFSGQGVAQDYAQSLEWYTKSASRGNALAMYIIGTYYWNGTGVTKSLLTAIDWYKKAADRGSADAMASLGYDYLNGFGLAKDYSEAFKWCKSPQIWVRQQA